MWRVQSIWSIALLPVVSSYIIAETDSAGRLRTDPDVVSDESTDSGRVVQSEGVLEKQGEGLTPVPPGPRTPRTVRFHGWTADLDNWDDGEPEASLSFVQTAKTESHFAFDAPQWFKDWWQSGGDYGRADPLQVCLDKANEEPNPIKRERRKDSCNFWKEYSGHGWQKGESDRYDKPLVYCFIGVLFILCAPCLWWMYSLHRDGKEQEARRHEQQLMHAMQARGLVPAAP